MSSSSKPHTVRNVPPPTGGVGSKPGNAYTRFIPREELSSFQAWRPGTIDGVDRRKSSQSSPVPEPPAAAADAERLGELARARAAGAQEGYQNGYRDGLVALESFKQSLAMQSTTQLAGLMSRLEGEFDALQPHLAQTVAQVAVELAQQVLKTELALQPELVAQVATQALEAMLFSAKHITVAVHPLDQPLVQAAAADALSARGARVVANAALTRGDVLVHADIGTIDARGATRWQQATAHLGVAAAGAAPVPAAPEPDEPTEGLDT